MIWYSVPADFKIQTLYDMKKLEEKYPGNSVREVFGNLSGSRWPSGHGFLRSQKYLETFRELEKYVQAAGKLGYDFNYTFNAACLDNKDIIDSELEEILEFIGNLADIGVRRITIASPALIGAVHRRYPSLLITASAITGVNSAYRANEVQKLGASTVVLEEDLTRDFKRIRGIAKYSTPDIEIIVNSKCTFNCLYRNFHYNSVSHDTGGRKTVFNYGGNCAKCREQDPVQFIKSLWIRPEDIELYAEQGVKVFKLIGRERLSDIDLLRMIEVYFSRSYDGNLVDLVFGFATTRKHIYIDNKKLDGFIDKFVNEEFECLDACSPEHCNYCQTYLEKSLVKEKYGIPTV